MACAQPPVARGRWVRVKLPRLVSPIVLALALSSASAGCAPRGAIAPTAVELNRLGAQALAQGDLDTAAARLSLAIEYHPLFVEAWINLGVLALARGEIDRAEERFRRAVSIDREASRAIAGLGVIEERRGKTLAAEHRYREALAIDPGLSEPRANLARLLAARGALDEARDQLERLVEVQPRDPAAWLALCEVLWRMERDPEAAAKVDLARANVGITPETELLLARRDLRAGATDEAVARLSLLAASPGTIGRAAGGWLGVAELVRGDKEAAARAAQRVLSRDPEDALAQHVLAASRS
jgi:Tfp pilus assembly protein PilF